MVDEIKKENKEIVELKNIDDYRNWIINQDWYQTIDLKNGLTTAGKVNTNLRIKWFDQFNFKNKTVLDIGCNSGQYSLNAKKLGAKSVVGIDIDKNRIYQAKMLAKNEDLDVKFNEASIENAHQFGKFDIVICIAVITEVENILGAIRAIKKATIETAILEMDLARPLIYMSLNKNWWKKNHDISKLGRVAEVHKHKHAGWVIRPSIDMVREIFGTEYRVSFLGKGLRYYKLVIERIKNNSI
tara:strand:+ start:264 stop:989 length:726 start_codon:yes stop_codon:yes gene_type:complete